jgi:hypothetical protein
MVALWLRLVLSFTAISTIGGLTFMPLVTADSRVEGLRMAGDGENGPQNKK